MIDIAVGITTAPRDVNYLGLCLDSYFDEGFPRPHVFCEPGSDKFINSSKVEVHCNPEKLGCFKNWRAGALWLLDNTSSPWIMMCQDDIQFNEGAGAALSSFLIDPGPFGVVSLYAAWANGNPDYEPGWGPYINLNIYGLCGALCLTFDREVLRKIVESDMFQGHDLDHDLDGIIGVLAQTLGKCYIHTPTLIAHIGEHSALYGKAGLVSTNKRRMAYEHSFSPF